MIYQKPPKKFSPRFEVVSCFFECNGQILLLHRWPEKSQGNKWGVPAGKIEPGETPLQAMVREVREETSVNISPKDCTYFKKIFVRYPDYDFVYYMFYTRFDKKPAIMISSTEHRAFMWASMQDALKMDIVFDLDACITLFYNL